MQNTQQNSFAEYVINMVCDFMNYCRGNMSITDMFTPTLAVLYAMHKGYHIKVYDNRQMEFYTDINNDDKLYHDLLGLIPHAWFFVLSLYSLFFPLLMPSGCCMPYQMTV